MNRTKYIVFCMFGNRERDIDFASIYEAMSFAKSLSILSGQEIRVLETNSELLYSVEYTVSVEP